MNKIVDEIMNAFPNRYWIEIHLQSGVTIRVDCCECLLAFDHETLELEIHPENTEFLDTPILKIAQEDIIAWE